jgi:hypothetical protein
VKQAPTKLSADLTSIPGASIECGDEVWDPLELAQWRDFNELRATELANGRAAMLASVGWVWPQVFGLWKTGLPVKTTDPIDAITQVPTAAWCGPQQPSSKKRAVKSEIERDPRNSQNVCGRKDDGRTEMGKNWTKGKGKNSQRKYGKQHRTGNGENITEIQTIPKRYTSEEKEPEMELT